jgi:hypothetical protein
MFPAPPFSMFRYAVWQVDQVPESVHAPHSWCSNPGRDLDYVYEYLPEEPGLILDESDFVSSLSPADTPIVET